MLPVSRISVDQLLRTLKAKDVIFTRDGDNLRVSAPKGVLGQSEADAIRACKPEILTRLAARSAAADVVLPVAERKEKERLGYLQERMWSHQQMFPNLPLYNLAIAWRIRGELDTLAFQRALKAIVIRHEILRSRFSTEEGVPYVSFADDAGLALPVEALDPATTDQELMIRLEALRDAPLKLEQGENFRAKLFRFSHDNHVFFFAPHHIVWDGLSWDVFLNDLSAFYEQETGGVPADLPVLTRQYHDYAAWHRSWMDTPALEEETEYWRSYYSKDTPALALPSDVKRPKLFTYEGDAVVFAIDAETHRAAHKIASKNQCTNFIVFLAVWQAFLSRYTGNPDIVVSAPSQGRHHEGLEDLIGCFGNVLGARQIVDGNDSFADFLKRSRDGFLDVLERQNAPMEHLAATLRGNLDISRTSLSQAMFTHQNEAQRAQSVGDLSLEMINIAPGGAPTDIRLEIIESADGALAEVNYANAVMTREGAEYLADCFKVFLKDAVNRPDRRICDLAIMADAERTRLVYQFNDTQTDYARDAMSFDYFDRIATQRRDAPAVSMDSATISYGALQSRANRIGNLLRARGVREGDIVAVYLDRSIDMVAAILGVWKAGAAMLPLDPEFPEGRLSYMIEDSQAKAALTSTRLVSDWLKAATMIVDIESETMELSAASGAAPVIDRAKASRAYVIYTSGSTGAPKGVENTHRAHCNFIESMMREPGMSAEDRLLAVTTVSFDVMLLELFVTLSAGAEVILASDDDAMDGFALADIIDKRDVTVLQGTPATWRILLDAGWKGASGLKGLCGGEAMPAALADVLPGMIGELWNMYGPTETTVWSTCARIKSAADIHIGAPIANTQVYVRDEAGCPAPAGVAGDLWIGGDGVAIGYLRKPELTAQRFAENPYAPELGRIYNTGDRASWRRDGNIEIAGRRDEQVKIRGYRIELGDIEAALAKHPAVRYGAAAVRNDQSGEPSLVAYVVFKDDAKATNSELRRFMRGHVPQYMVPQFFMVLAAMPLTNNNKIDRKALPAPAGVSAARRRVGPRDEREKVLAGVWKEILKTDDVSVTDNFFELGGQSLQVARMIARLRDVHGLRISPRAVIFESLEQLAAGAARETGTKEQSA